MLRRGGRRADGVDEIRVLDELEPAAAPVGVPVREADVVRDLQKPGDLDVGDDAAPESALRVEERRLERVLGFVRRAESAPAVRQDARTVPFVHRLDRGAGGVCSTDDGIGGHFYTGTEHRGDEKRKGFLSASG